MTLKQWFVPVAANTIDLVGVSSHRCSHKPKLSWQGDKPGITSDTYPRFVSDHYSDTPSPFCCVVRKATKQVSLRQRFDNWLILDICFWLQVPITWWVPEVANAARTQGTTRREISMKEVLELQLATDAATVWLPKYLLVVYQLTK